MGATGAGAQVDANFTFSPSDPVVNETIQFTDTSTGNPTNWQWDFDNDGVTDSTVQNPTFSFRTPGTYPVTLIVLIPPADTDAVVKNVVVGPDDDTPGNLSFTMSSYTVNEGAGTASIPVRRTGGSDGTVSVRCVTSNGSATAGSDYTATNVLLTWTNGDTNNKNCVIPIADDGQDEPNETVNLDLTNFVGAGMGTPTSATLTIIDNDPTGNAGNLSFTMSSYTVNEGAGTASIPVRRTGGSTGTVSVRCVTSDGSATAGSDYTSTNVQLTWTNGDTSNKNCVIPIADDGQDEPNETVDLDLTNFVGAGMGTPTSATLTIIDNDPASNAGNLSFTQGTYTVNEAAGTASIPVRRTDGSDGTVSVRCVTSNGSATAGSDYANTNVQLTWTNGDTSNKNCIIPITNDSEDEPNETINLDLTNFVGAGMGTPTSATLTIIDDDPTPDPGDLSFTMSSYTVNEAAGTASIPVRRTGGSDGAVSVRCVTSNGSATAGSDYTATNVQLTWTNGDTSNKNCVIPITNDSQDEPNETVELDLTNFVGAGMGTPTSATLTIVDDDPTGMPGALQFTFSSYTVTEDVGEAEIDVRRVNGTDGPVSVRCNASNGTATAPEDFLTTSDVLEWPDGVGGLQTCTVPIVDDLIQEGDETLNLFLNSFLGGAVPGSPTTAILTITANDDFGELSFSAASYTVDEAVGTASIAVTRTGGSDNAVSVRCDTSDDTATAPDDYLATTDELNWDDGDTADKICTVPIVKDTNDEPTETVNLTLTNFSPGAGMGDFINATLQITDNDEAGDLSFVMASYTVDEDTGIASIDVQRTGGSDGPVSVRCNTSDGSASAPGDYTATSDILTWGDGDTSLETCTVPIIDDFDDEPAETVDLSFSDFTGGAEPGIQDTATLTITDNDEAGDLSFTMSTYEVDEEDDLVALIAVQRTGGSDGPVSVRCVTSDNTATAPDDYIATVDILTWPHGETTDKICTVPINDDSLPEVDEFIDLSLSDFTGGATAGTQDTAILTIAESDIPGDLGFTTASFSVDEDGGSASITVQRTNGANGAVSVECHTSNGSAIEPADYGATVDVLTWSDGETTNKTCTVPIVDDTIDEEDETVSLTLVNFTDGAQMGSIVNATLTIVDDDEAGTFSFVAAGSSIGEGAGAATVAVRRSGGSGGAVTVQCSSADGSASAPGDYGSIAEVLSWTDGDTADKHCTVPIVDDSDSESDETVDLSLSAPTGGATVGAPSSAVLTIVDDDDHGELSFSTTHYTVDEDSGFVSISVRRTAGSDGAVSVRCNATAGTATATDDFAVTMDVLDWADGDTADKHCTVPIVNDSVDEADETVDLTLTDFTGGAATGTHTMATLTILDDDDAGTLGFSMASYEVDEGVGTASFTVRRTGGSNGAVSVLCSSSNGSASAGSDYTATTDNLDWGDGDTADKQCTVPIADDSADEGDETFTLTLGGATGGASVGAPSTATVTILDDDDHGALGFSAASYTVDEDAGVASITVQRTGGSDGAVSVRCNATAGTATATDDFTVTMDILDWPDGDTGDRSCIVPIVDDSLDEGDETIALGLSDLTGGAGTGAISSATLTITDDDDAGELSFSMATYTVDESVGTASITVQRTGGSNGAVSVSCGSSDDTAAAGSDYTATTDALAWADGDTTDKLCTVPITDDDAAESDESFTLMLSGATGGASVGAPSTTTVTITDDDDHGTLGFSMAGYTVDEDAVTASIVVQRTGGSDGLVSVRCTATAGTATATADFTVTMDVLTWADGDTLDKDCTVPIVDDSVDEGDETVSLALDTFTGGAGMGTAAATLTITDDDAVGELSFSMAGYTVDEGVGTAMIAVQRTGGSDGAVGVDCSTTVGGSATATDDYTTTMQTLDWADGETVDKFCTIAIVDDSDDEVAETVALLLSGATGGAVLGAQDTATLTITDNDGAGELSFSSATYAVDEDAGTASITVQRTGGSNGAVGVDCNTIGGGSAIATDDYATTTETLSWADGDTTDQTCTIPIVDDSDDESDETVNLSLSDATGGASLGTPDTATLTITDDEGAGTLSFSSATYEVEEGAGPASITVRRTDGSAGAVSVDCVTTGDTATDPDDYMAPTMATLSWADGETTDKICTIPIVDDSDDESDETVDLSLTGVSGGATLGAQDTAILTILDDEVGVLGFSAASYVFDEGVGLALITVTRTGGSDGAVSVRCETSDGTATVLDGDYLATVQWLSWNDGDTADKFCEVPILDDALSEGDEALSLDLTGATGGASLNASATLMISDNDSPGALSFSMSDYTVDEADGTASVTVVRTGDTGGVVSVRCVTSDGTATAPGDYGATSDLLTWPNGDGTDRICTIPIVDDSADESTETVDLQLTDFLGGAGMGTTTSATLMITDNDEAGDLSFSMPGYTVDESAGAVSVTVRRTGGSDGAVSVECRTVVGGSASAGDDYLDTVQVVSWSDEDTADKTCSVPIVDDALLEGDETIDLALAAATGGASLGTPASAIITITDNDSPGQLRFSSATYTVNEDVGTASIQVERIGGTDGTVTVLCATADQTATAPADYGATSDLLTWGDGISADQICTIPIVDDNVGEGGEDLELMLIQPTGGATLAAPSSATLTITDNDTAGTIRFTASGYTVDESAGSALIEVRREGGSDGAVSVECSTVAGGSASAGDDYLDTLQVVSWSDGDTVDKTCSVPILDDALTEVDETVELALGNPTGGAGLGTPDTATLTLLDDDSPGELAFSAASYLVNEDVGAASITVTRTGGTDGTVTARCDTSDGTATAPEDYGATMELLTWGDGDGTDKTCTVPIVDDTDQEGSETLGLALTHLTGGATLGTPSSATLEINDDDLAGTLQFSMATYTADEATGNALIAVRRIGRADNAVSVLCSTVVGGTATADDDYLTTAQTLNWGPGELQDEFCSIPIFDDGEAESDETVVLELSGATGGALLGIPSTATLTLEDDDGSGQLRFSMASYTVSETAGSLTVQVERVGGTDGIVTVRCDTADGTANAPDDYTAQMATLTWGDGDGSDQTCTIPIVDDTTPEGDETFTLDLVVPTGGATLGMPSSATVTIGGSDDPGNLSFTSSDYRVGEGDGVATITVERTGGFNGMVTVRCDTSNGTAVAGSDYTATMQVLTWIDGDVADKTCRVPILDNDGAAEGNETVDLSLTNFTGGAGMGSPINATLTIVEDLFSDGFESGDTSGWSNAIGFLKMGGVRRLSYREPGCDTVDPTAVANAKGSIRLSVPAGEVFELSISSLEGEAVFEVAVESASVVEMYDLPFGLYEVGVTDARRDSQFWTLDLGAATPCTTIDLDPENR